MLARYYGAILDINIACHSAGIGDNPTHGAAILIYMAATFVAWKVLHCVKVCMKGNDELLLLQRPAEDAPLCTSAQHAIGAEIAECY